MWNHPYHTDAIVQSNFQLCAYIISMGGPSGNTLDHHTLDLLQKVYKSIFHCPPTLSSVLQPSSDNMRVSNFIKEGNSWVPVVFLSYYWQRESGSVLNRWWRESGSLLNRWQRESGSLHLLAEGEWWCPQSCLRRESGSVLSRWRRESGSLFIYLDPH